MLNALFFNASHCLDRNQITHVHTDSLFFSLQEAQTTRQGENLHKQRREERQYPNAAAEKGRKEGREKALCTRRHLSHGLSEQRKAHLRRAAYGWEHIAWHYHTQPAFLSQGRHFRSVAQKGYCQIEGHIHVGILVLKLSTCTPEAFLPGLHGVSQNPGGFAVHIVNPLCRLKPTSSTCRVFCTPIPSSLPIPME